MQMSCIVQLVQFLFFVVHPQASPNFNRICIVQLPAVSSRLRGATVASGPFTSVKSELTRELFTFCIALLFFMYRVPKF